MVGSYWLKAIDLRDSVHELEPQKSFGTDSNAGEQPEFEMTDGHSLNILIPACDDFRLR